MPDEIRRPALYVVATPIGNLRDITLRALDVLRSVDLIAAEDTRITARLLSQHAIEKPVLALHQHNEKRAGMRLVAALESGKAAALVSDAGTPALSDPGATLVAAVRLRGFEVIPVPGASALAAAWSVAGLHAPGFVFHGFLPARTSERRGVLERLAGLPYALVFYEAPHRVEETVRDMSAVLGPERPAVIVRELTKLFESIHSCALGELGAWLAADANRVRGEFVIMVDAAKSQAPRQALGESALRVLLDELPPAQAARLAARISGVDRGALYDLVLKWRKDSSS
ncbi:MAG: 16S rRNA (cytidine(1402)-2'-O)-methyltransferase [Burkholderiales bacterium]|nr:16S rRNA (cytidine(1402)-2'-O)-methyltransferase [Burkholderiales bacterium]